MSNFSYQLEKYKGTNSRFRCPKCGQKEFARYVNKYGEHLFDDVGFCNRQTKCGYHRTPKEFFAENPHLSEIGQRQGKARINTPKADFAPKKALTHEPRTAEQTENQTLDFIEDENLIVETWQNYEQNSFVKSLYSIFDENIVQGLIKTFRFGSGDNGTVIFWQFDKDFRTRTGKIMLYDETSGKRKALKSWIDKETGELCELKLTWIHAQLKKQGKLKADFALKQCFFGEHLLTSNAEIKTVAIVESEKTAIIAQGFWQHIIFLACGGVHNLSLERMKVLRDKRILLFPDGGCFDLWNKKAKEFVKMGFSVKVSDLIEPNADDDKKKKGLDLADFLIEERKAEFDFERIERESLQSF